MNLNSLMKMKIPRSTGESVEALLASISICDNHRPDLRGSTRQELMMYQVVGRALMDMFDGDVEITEAWYKNATDKDIDSIRLMIALDEGAAGFFN